MNTQECNFHRSYSSRKIARFWYQISYGSPQTIIEAVKWHCCGGKRRFWSYYRNLGNGRK